MFLNSLKNSLRRPKKEGNFLENGSTGSHHGRTTWENLLAKWTEWGVALSSGIYGFFVALKDVNIVEARFNKECWTLMSVLNDDVLWINKHSRIVQKVWKLCDRYQDIYDLISPLNKLSDLWFILTQLSMGENEKGKSSHLSIFTSLKHLPGTCGMVLLKWNYFRASFFTLYQRYW